MSWFPICSRQVKKIRKIMFLCIGGGLLLTLGYDLLELFCAFIPGEIHIYSCGDVDLREPLEISVKAISSSSDKYAVTRSLPFAIYADSVSPLLLHKRGKKVFYSIGFNTSPLGATLKKVDSMLYYKHERPYLQKT